MTKNMADYTNIFDEDEVCIPTPGGFKYGLVVESSEYVSSDEDEYDDEHRVKNGTVKVAWHPLGKETVVPEKKLILADRSLMPGDVVRRLILGTESQRGFVEDLTVTGHVKILGTEQWIYNVDIKDVLPMQEWDPEPEVVLDSWVGSVVEVREDIVVRFPDGARCLLHDAGFLNMEDVNERNDRREEHSEFALRCFYPGQELYGCYEDYQQGATWLTSTNLHGADAVGAKSLYNLSVIVEQVETKSVEVRWICKGFTKVGTVKDTLESPPSLVEGEALKRMKKLQGFEHCHTQIGDKGYYVVKEMDAVLHNMSPQQHMVPDILQVKNENMTVLGASSDGLYVMLKDSEKRTKDGGGNGTAQGNNKENRPKYDVNVDAGGDADDEFEDVENDNSDANSTHSATELPIMKRKNRKRPGLQMLNMRKYRGKRAKTKPKKEDRVVNVGDKVPVEVWYTFSSCNVRWQDGTLEEKVPSPDLFPIHHLDELEFFPGDFVIDVKGNVSNDYGAVVSCDHRERTCIVKWMTPYIQGKTERPEVRETTEVSVYDIKDHPDYKFRVANTVIRVGGFEDSEGDLDAVGQVYKLDQQGLIHVWWPSKKVTVCYPQDLYLIGEEVDATSSDEDEWTTEEEEEDEESGSETGTDVSWETEDEEEVSDSGSDDDTASREKEKPSVQVSDSKKKDVDELIQRVQSALTGLLDVFLNAPGPFFKNSKQVFQDILAVFKRCKEMEKIMKSSFFEDTEVTQLIQEIKEQLRKEKTNKMAQHVAQMYESRNNISVYHGQLEAVTDGQLEAVIEDIKSTVNNACANGIHSGSQSTPEASPAVNNHSADSNSTANGKSDLSSASLPAANGGSELDSNSSLLSSRERNLAVASLAAGKDNILSHVDVNQVTQVNRAIDSMSSEQVKKLLSRYVSRIDDPIEQIIFDTCLHSAVSKSKTQQLESTDKSSHNGSDCSKLCDTALDMLEDNSHIGNCDKLAAEKACDDTDDTLNVGAASPSDDVGQVKSLKTAALQKVQEVVNLNSHMDTLLQPCQQPETSATGSSFIPETDKATQHTDTETTQGTAGIPATHRDLCIRVCTALNCRLLKIQQDLTMKWMAYKFGCDKNASDKSLFEKMEEKMVEALEITDEPLKLVSVDEVTEDKDISDKTETQECITELQTLENSRTSPSGSEAAVSRGSVSPELTTDTSGAGGSAEQTGFELCSETSAGHWFKFKDRVQPVNQKSFTIAVRREVNLLITSLPEGIIVKAFEDRMDLYSVMIYGPSRTPYEDGLFMFDVQLPAGYPAEPPLFRYLSFTNERLNPNLYEDGKVCVSLLGTWSGKGSERWTNNSNLLQVLVSIQGLILVSEPYFNEAGYEKQRGTQIGQENSRMYNEMAILKLVQSMTKMALTPPSQFENETREHLRKHARGMIDRLESWITISGGQCSNSQSVMDGAAGASQSDSTSDSNPVSCDQSSTNDNRSKKTPGFPLLPASKGFCLTLKKYLENFECVLKEHIWERDTGSSK